MIFKKNEKNGKAFVEIRGAMTVQEAAALGKDLLDCMEKNNSLELDLSKVDDCDTAGLQLLYSAGKTAKEKKKDFSVTTFSDKVKDAAGSIGLNLDNI